MLETDVRSMTWRLALTTIVLAICVGCGGGNGFPKDLARHLAENGITLKVMRSHAPLNSRGGYVIAQHNVPTANAIVSTFKLRPVPADDPGWKKVSAQWTVGTQPTAIFAATGRPTALKLKNGSQFEHLYLVVMGDGTMWLFAEYAYG